MLAEGRSRERERLEVVVRIPQQTLVFKTQDPSELSRVTTGGWTEQKKKETMPAERSRCTGCNQDNETEHHKAPSRTPQAQATIIVSPVCDL